MLQLPALAMLCSGCMLIRHTDSPGASGVVMDGSSHSPLQGVEVTMSYSSGPSVSLTNALLNFRPPLTLTDAAGKFAVPASTSFTLETLLAFPGWFSSWGTTNSALWAAGTLVLRHEGFEPRLIPVFAKRTSDTGLIEMQTKRP